MNTYENPKSPEIIREELVDLFVTLGERMKGMTETLKEKPRLQSAIWKDLIDFNDVRTNGDPSKLDVVGKSLIAVNGLDLATKESSFFYAGDTLQERLQNFVKSEVIDGIKVTDADKESAVQHLQNFSALLDEMDI